MSKTIIEQRYKDPLINLALDTISKNKQAIIFVNSKASAESTAEKIAKKIKLDGKTKEIAIAISEESKNTLNNPTKQCERLSLCLNSLIAFHHSGLAAKQKTLVEKNFKKGLVKIICATPTLAAGINLPAFRTIIRDTKRYGSRGMMDILVLEYEQQAGRAGRPGHEDYGEAIILAKTEIDRKRVIKKYINGTAEDITSKLAVEPVLRTYVLSLISTEFCTTEKELINFFSKTFYAHIYSDLKSLKNIIQKMIFLLKEWDFITNSETINQEQNNDFISANKLEKTGKLKSTLLGKKVSELYIDPLSAHTMLEMIKKYDTKIKEQKTKNNEININITNTEQQKSNSLSLIHMLTKTIEFRPMLYVKSSEYDKYELEAEKWQEHILSKVPNIYDIMYEEYINEIKTASFVNDWINEYDEEYLLKTYNVRPGDLKALSDISDWLLKAASELARIIKCFDPISDILKLQARINHGVKEELLNLMKLKRIGKTRARILYNNNIKVISDVKNCDFNKLKQLIGEKNAVDVKDQVGIKITIQPKEKKEEKKQTENKKETTKKEKKKSSKKKEENKPKNRSLFDF
jgi:helicase